MKAVVMAGGEGSRLRPMTANLPKPLLPVANRPVMEHVLRLLRRHGITDTVVTVQFLASLVRNYFGDGDELGIALQYATEPRPLGTAGSVKNAEGALRDDTFLVMSGDALTDVDLDALIDVHRRSGALVTVGLKSVPDPLEYGIVIREPDGRITRFLEKPTWGQVFSDTVNTGIYVMEPEVLRDVPEDTEVDWSADVFPLLLERGAPLYGCLLEGYWEDVGTLESYHQAHAAVLNREVEVEIDAFEVSPGVWLGEGAEVDPDTELAGPLLIGDYSRVEAGASVQPYTVLGANVVMKTGALTERAIVHDNVFIGPRASLRGCVVGRNTDVMRAARIDEGAVVGDDCVVEQEAFLSAGVRVYPFKTVDAGAVVTSSVIWESRGHRSLFGPRGVTGLVNVEITPDLAVRLASAWATTLRKGSTVITSRDVSRAATALKRAVVSALTASAIDVRDLEVAPAPVARFATAHSDAVGGVMIHTTPGDPQSVDLVFLDETGADLTPSAQRRLERVFSRQEFRRAFPGEIAQLSYPARTVDTYAQEVLAAIDASGIEGSDLRVVIDTAGGAAAVVLPTMLGRMGVDALIVNGRLDESVPTETLASHMQGLARLGELVASSRASFGARFDPVAERLALVDERGRIIHDDRALLVVMDLVAAERRGGLVALPVTTTRVAEQVAAFHGVDIVWTGTSATGLSSAATGAGVVFAGDGRGGFVVPEFSPAVDGIAAFARLVGLVARTKLTMSEIDARIPEAFVVRRAVPTPWSAKGTVMRAVLEAAAGRVVDTTDGVRIVEGSGAWALVLPDPAEAVTHLWAEAANPAAATQLLDTWAEVVERSHG
jgi:mannose-1-phosphate guanylyltransferase / phosphomannomutase